MKNITYRGEEYIVEDWVNFVAMDDCGEIYAYENLPIRSMTSGEFLNAIGDLKQIGIDTNGWENSLEKV